MQARTILIALILSAGAALAHQGVQNPAVKARMDAMSAIADNTRILGEMAKGARPFDATDARAAAAAIADHAGQTPDLFAAPEQDPKSEALPAIWTDFDDFTALSAALQVAAEKATGITTPEDLRPALAAIGGACKACHERYRE